MTDSRLGAANACFSPPIQSSMAGSKILDISPAGTAFIQKWEAFSSSLYDDVAGHCTVGFGHLVHKGNCDNSPSESDFTNGITKAQGTFLMASKLSEFVATVRSSVAIELTQYEFDALVSFAYNVGSRAFRDSTLLRLVNSGQWSSIRGEMLQWVNAGHKRVQGLVNRRNAEANLFLQGFY